MKFANFTGVKSLLFENKTLKQTIFKNTFWLGLAEGVTKILNLILFIYAARILGATEYGKLTFAFAFVGLFTVLTEMGVPNIMVREFAKEERREQDFPAIISLALLLNIGTLLLIILGSYFITPDSIVRKVIWILALYTSLNVLSHFFSSFFRARQQMQYESITKIFRVLILVILGLYILLNFPSVESLSYGYLFASFVALVLIILIFYYKVGSLQIVWSKTIWKKFLSMSWPLALAGIFGTIYTQIDSVMMGHLGQITQTGWYNAAYRIIGATLIPLSLISTSFYPVLSKYFKESRRDFQKAWDYQAEILIFLSIPIIIGGFVLSSKIIYSVYGLDFFSSILAFQILIWMVGAYYLSSPFQSVLVISDQQKKIFWIVFSGAIVNIILNLILIPKFSLYGAAVATVTTYFLILLLSVYFASKFTSVQFLNFNLFFSFVNAIFSSIVMYLVISQPLIYNLNIFLSVLAGAAVYILSFFVFRIILQHFKFYA